jgi:hypothetical protein
MLERQQIRLVSALKEMYHRLQNVSAWVGPSKMTIADILSALDVHNIHHDSSEVEVFGEDHDKLRSMMNPEDVSLVYQRMYASSESGNSHLERPNLTYSIISTVTRSVTAK